MLTVRNGGPEEDIEEDEAADLSTTTFDLSESPFQDQLELTVCNPHPSLDMVYTFSEFYFSGVCAAGSVDTRFPALASGATRTHQWLIKLGRHREPGLPFRRGDRQVAFRCNLFTRFVQPDPDQELDWEDLLFEPNETHLLRGFILLPARVTPYFCFNHWLE
jgi:hypothetical protein